MGAVCCGGQKPDEGARHDAVPRMPRLDTEPGDALGDAKKAPALPDVVLSFHGAPTVEEAEEQSVAGQTCVESVGIAEEHGVLRVSTAGSGEIELIYRKETERWLVVKSNVEAVPIGSTLEDKVVHPDDGARLEQKPELILATPKWDPVLTEAEIAEAVAKAEKDRDALASKLLLAAREKGKHPPPHKFDMEAALTGVLPRGPRLVILGGTSYTHAESEALTAALARQLPRALAEAGVGSMSVLTSGQPGVQETFSKSLSSSLTSKLRHLLPDGHSSGYGVGEDVICGMTLEESETLRVRMGDVFLTVEGGPAVAKEAQMAMHHGATVVPLMSTGGASGGMFGFPAHAFERPAFATEAQWAVLSGGSAGSAEKIAEAAADIAAQALHRASLARAAASDGSRMLIFFGPGGVAEAEAETKKLIPGLPGLGCGVRLATDEAMRMVAEPLFKRLARGREKASEDDAEMEAWLAEALQIQQRLGPSVRALRAEAERRAVDQGLDIAVDALGDDIEALRQRIAEARGRDYEVLAVYPESTAAALRQRCEAALLAHHGAIGEARMPTHFGAQIERLAVLSGEHWKEIALLCDGAWSLKREAEHTTPQKAGQKHVLCTGGAGYIGSHTVVRLVESGFKVSIMDNLQNANAKVLERLRELTGQHIPFYKVDMCDRPAVHRLFAKHHFDGVIHFAGLKAVGESVAEPMWYYQNNIDGTLVLMEAMERYGCNTIVFSSSATVYMPCEEPIDEGKPMGCSNPYGWTKYMIEQILQDGAKANSSLAVSLLRYFNPCGSHPSGRLGESPNGIPNNLMPFLQQVAVGRREHLNVFGSDFPTPDGTGVRDYIHVDDLAEGHICALKKLFEMGKGVIVHNLGSGKGFSVLEMLKALERAAGKTLPYKLVDARPGDLSTVVANPGKAKKDFDWETKRGLTEIMESAWKWQSENPYGFDDAPEVTAFVVEEDKLERRLSGLEDQYKEALDMHKDLNGDAPAGPELEQLRQEIHEVQEAIHEVQETIQEASHRDSVQGDEEAVQVVNRKSSIAITTPLGAGAEAELEQLVAEAAPAEENASVSLGELLEEKPGDGVLSARWAWDSRATGWSVERPIEAVILELEESPERDRKVRVQVRGGGEEVYENTAAAVGALKERRAFAEAELGQGQKDVKVATFTTRQLLYAHSSHALHEAKHGQHVQPPPDRRWLRGVAVPHEVFESFLEAAKADSAASGDFFDKMALSESIRWALRPELEAIRAAGDKALAVQRLGKRWGLGVRWVRGAAVPHRFTEDFLVALEAEYVNHVKSAVDNFFEKKAVPELVQVVLRPEQVIVREAKDSRSAVKGLAQRWGESVEVVEEIAQEMMIERRVTRKSIAAVAEDSILASLQPTAAAQGDAPESFKNQGTVGLSFMGNSFFRVANVDGAAGALDDHLAQAAVFWSHLKIAKDTLWRHRVVFELFLHLQEVCDSLEVISGASAEGVEATFASQEGADRAARILVLLTGGAGPDENAREGSLMHALDNLQARDKHILGTEGNARIAEDTLDAYKGVAHAVDSSKLTQAIGLVLKRQAQRKHAAVAPQSQISLVANLMKARQAQEGGLVKVVVELPEKLGELLVMNRIKGIFVDVSDSGQVSVPTMVKPDATAGHVKEELFAKVGVPCHWEGHLYFGDAKFTDDQPMSEQGFPNAAALARMAETPVLRLEAAQARGLPYEQLGFDVSTVVPVHTSEVPSWAPANTQVIGDTAEEANFAGKAPFIEHLNSVSQAVAKLNADPGLCIAGIAVVYSSRMKNYVLLWRSDKLEEAEYKFHMESQVRQSAVWSLEVTHNLCGPGEEAVFQDKAKLFSQFSSVSQAIDQLNADTQVCPAGICVVFSEGKQRFFLLYRADMRQQAQDKFNIEDKVKPTEAEVHDWEGSSPELVLWPGSESEEKFRCSRFAQVPRLGSAALPQRVPQAARKEAFIYPSQQEFHHLHDAHSVEETVAASAEKDLFKYGGFAYLGEDDELLRVNALHPTEYGTIRFGPRHNWHFGAETMKEARMFRQANKAAAKYKAGARHFCWLTPGEHIDGTAMWRNNRDSAGFVYLFNEDMSPHVADCCFVRQEPFQISMTDEDDKLEEYLRVFSSPWEKIADGIDRSAEAIARFRLQR